MHNSMPAIPTSTPVRARLPDVAPLEGRPLLVHFLGTPGVGKTTLIRATLNASAPGGRSTSGGYPWISHEKAWVLAVRNFAREANYPRLEATGLLRGSKAVVRAVLRPLKRVIGHDPVTEAFIGFQRRAVSEFLGTHDLVFSALAAYWFEPEISPPPLAVRYWELAQYVGQWLFVVAYARSVGVLADNTRLTRGTAELLANPTFSEVRDNMDRMRSFCLSELGPRGIVHLDADPEAVLERVRTRAVGGFLHAAHRGRSDEAILGYTRRRNEVNRRAVGVFSSWGIPVVTIDGSKPIATNVEAVHTFLRGLRP